ncbi:hypothetical protein Caci_6857 [Catenulispora acidiphila DSM 44928]|uniref:Uncharacterized protein n=1 Tax=Catenulispora acidiphila (strain DSM 44928 / JCM 14897 / NBRC 102108 / NRRL B-24433 / ID139908) TaxID=479433 RepID=C7Q1Z6_CATAD|nr:hypothetical protein [Catenulispora acidiphila]ACU75697.1 hypothetical protein Caci_6857 [Catenulispora acidiphila DSM 44928]
MLLAALTEELLPVAWQRFDQDSFGRRSTEFRRLPHRAVLTVTANAVNGTNVHLFSGEIDVPWRVTADDPDPVVIAAAANAALDESRSLGAPLTDLLVAASWHREADEFGYGAAERRWVSPDGQRDAIQFSDDCERLNDWLISLPPTRLMPRRTQYVTSPYTPAAVLAAVALGDALLP